MKKTTLFLLSLLLLAGCEAKAPSSDLNIGIGVEENAQIQSSSIDEAEDEEVEAEEIVVSTPQPGDSVESPLVIEGEARGNWYFEGSFIARLVDTNQNELAFASAFALGEWMTEDFVPFKAEFDFQAGELEGGIIVLENENPSGLIENQRRLEIPVKF